MNSDVSENIDRAIQWYFRHQCDLKARLERGPLVVGEVSYLSPRALDALELWFEIYERGLSTILATAYILIPLRRLKAGLIHEKSLGCDD